MTRTAASPLRHKNFAGTDSHGPKNAAAKSYSGNYLWKSAARRHDSHSRALQDKENRRISDALLATRHCAFDPDEDTHIADTGADENEAGEDAYFHWEEEKTLFSDLMNEEPKEEDVRLTALADSLQLTFDHEGKKLKKEIADTFVPTVNRAKEFYRAIEKQVDTPFGQGLLTFNQASREMEITAVKERDELQTAHVVAQKNIQDSMDQLQEEYNLRDQLWANFNKSINELVEPVVETLKATPARIERTITNIEKHSKNLEKDSSETLAEKKLKDLLSKIK